MQMAKYSEKITWV